MKEIFTEILRMSGAGGVVILTVLAARACLSRCPKKVTLFLWLPAALQLLCPVHLQSPVSLFNLFRRGMGQRDPAVVPDTAYGPGTANAAAGVANPVSLSDPEPVFPLPETVPAAESVQFWLTAAALLWCAGMAVMVIWAVLQYAGLERRMAAAVRMEGERNVYQSEQAVSPFILGLFRPKIYLPYRLEESVKRQVLLHERTHLHYGDHLTKLAAFGILTLHWFNPLCWLAFVLFGRDVEMRCDEAVLAHTEPAAYGTALVQLAVERRYSVTGPLAFGETSVKERVKHILHWKKPALWITIAAVVLCAVIGVVCVTDAVETPYVWTSAITAEDLAGESVHYHGEGAWSAELTPAQCEELAQCLQNVPESAMYIGRNIRRASKSIHLRIDMQDISGFLFWDGEHVIQKPAVSHFSIKPVWYLDSPELLHFFAQLEKAILAGQGTLEPESVPVSVSIAGTDTVIAPKKYTPGTWDHEYGELPVLTMTESGMLVIDVFWQPETLDVYEEYYHSLSSSSTTIRNTTYTASPNADGRYVLDVTRRNPALDERAIYYITHEEDKYIFKVDFPLPDPIEEAVKTIGQHPGADPEQSIKAHPELWTELLEKKEETLAYVFRAFLNREVSHQKTTQVMAQLLRELLGEEGLDESGHSWPGETYFLVWLSDIRSELYNNGEDWMRENKPLSWMCLSIAGDLTADGEE